MEKFFDTCVVEIVREIKGHVDRVEDLAGSPRVKVLERSTLDLHELMLHRAFF